MSNIIPMVSSSPPPMDEGGGFEWDDDDDDFGTFTSASDTSFAQSETSGKHDTSVHDHFNSGQQEKNFGGFADFGSFPSNELPDSLNKQCSKTAQNDHRPESITISDKTFEHEETSHINTEGNSHHNVNGQLVDSGVYSSNVSPVQYTEQSGSQEHVDTTVDNSNALHDLSGNLVDNLENTTDETNRSCTEIKCDTESSVSCDAGSSVTQENVSVINNSETNVDTEAQDDSVKHIPPKDIPETDHMHISDIAETEEETRKVEKDESDSVVIANCDDSISDDSDTKSSDENSHSVSNDARNQESGHGENKSETGLLKDTCNAGEVNECSSDLGYAGSENQIESHVEDSNNSVKRTEQESEHDSIAVADESKLGDQQTNLQQQFECSTVSSIELRDSVQEKPVTDMEINTFVKSGKSENVNESDQLSKEEIKFVDSMNGNGESPEHKEHLSDDDCKNAVEGGVSNNENAEKDTAKVSSDNDVISNSEEQNVNKIDQMDNEGECNLEDDLKPVDNVKPVDKFEDYTEPSNAHFQDGHMPVSDNNDAGLEDKDEFGDFSATVDTKLKDGSNSEVTENNADGLDDFNTGQVNSDEDFGGFNTNSDRKQEEIDPASDGVDEDDFGDFNASFDNKQVSSDSAVGNDTDDFGDFNASFPEKEDKKDPPDSDFGGFNATFDSVPNSSEQTNDWAAFSEPQTVIQDDIDDEDDDWAGFEEEECNASQFETVSSPGKVEQSEEASPKLAKMTKHEKILYAVTTCFPTLISDMEVSDLNQTELNDLHIDSDSRVWSEVKGQRTTEALSYQWAKSLWNTQLFTTLHIDTRNILIGHKKAPVPVFAAGLTLLEPTKGQAPLKPDVLIDTSKSDPSLTSHSQIPATSVPRPNKNESIPAAQFDWSSSGLTNPLEANNKTLNLDFLIQDQATKSNALESEFLSTNESPVHKPAIQPLENILANLKTSSTFKPTNQNEDVSKEASKVLLSLPDLVFMKSKVLMFPVNMNGSEN